MKRILELLGKGVIGLLPFLLLIWIMIFIYDIFAGIFLGIFGLSDSVILTICILIFIFLLMLYTGYLIEKKREIWVARILKYALIKIPIVTNIYSTLKDLVNMFSSKNTDYLGVAEVKISNIILIGFITKVEGDIYFIFVPTTPNPTSGFLLQMNKEDVKILDISVPQGFKKVISLGLR